MYFFIFDFLEECTNPRSELPAGATLTGNPRSPFLLNTQVSYTCGTCYTGAGSLLCTTIPLQVFPFEETIAWQKTGDCTRK